MIKNTDNLKSDYIVGRMSLQELSDKYNISKTVIQNKIKKENWSRDEISVDEFETRSKRILALSDRILDKVNSAIDEIDRQIIKAKEKSKIVKYDEDLKKPIYEASNETEKIEVIDSVIDTSALKQLVATLKDIKDIHMGFVAGGESEEDEETGVIMISPINQKDEEVG